MDHKIHRESWLGCDSLGWMLDDAHEINGGDWIGVIELPYASLEKNEKELAWWSRTAWTYL
jgi:hypothetical protein